MKFKEKIDSTFYFPSQSKLIYDTERKLIGMKCNYTPIISDLSFELPQLSIDTLQPDLIQKMRELKGTQVILGKLSPEWAIGLSIEALWINDGIYYVGNIKAATKDYYFIIAYNEYDDQEFLFKEDICKLKHYQLVYYKPEKVAKKCGYMDKICLPKELSGKFLIRKKDDDITIDRKRKILKHFKKQERTARLDLSQNKKVENWKFFSY